MKIVYIYHSLAVKGGLERVIVDKANYLAEKYGNEVYIITTDQGSNPIVYPLYKTVKHIDLGLFFYRIYNYSRLKRIIIYWNLRKTYKSKLTELLQSLHADITISTTISLIDFLPSIPDGSIKLIESHLAKEFTGNQHLYRRKNIIFKLIAQILDWKVEHSVKKNNALIALTEKDKKSWDKTLRTYIIPNALPFYPEIGSFCKNRKIICVGRLEKEKGYDLLIQTWKIVIEKHPEWSLHIYGDGSLKDELNKAISIEGLNNSLIIEGTVSDIYSKYIESSIFVMSSRYEGFAMVLIEAMACGLPIISFDCPNGPSDIILDGEDGFLIENGNIEVMAEKICYLIENENIRIEMGKKARENVKRYAPDIIMQKWVNLFNHLKTVK